MSLRVGMDLDGVIADFRSAFSQAATDAGVPLNASGSLAADPFSSRDIKRVWEHIRQTPNWWIGLKPCEPSQLARFYEMTRSLRWEVVFLTRRPSTLGDPVQYQSQWWLEQHGFFYPAVVTVPGSRGELANSLRLDVIVDDQVYNCVDVIGASPAKALLLLRDAVDSAVRERATSRGIGVVGSLEEALDVLEHLHATMKERRGRLQRLADWFSGREAKSSKPLPAPRPDRGAIPAAPGEPGD
jgi:hypothetical protein